MDPSLEDIAAKAAADLKPKPTRVEPETPSPDGVPPVPSPLKQIRTYEGDVAEAIRKQNESLISIQRAEEKKREAMKTLVPEASATLGHAGLRALSLALMTIVLITGGGFGAYYAWTTYKVRSIPPPIVTLPNQFISANNVRDVDASTEGRDSLITVIQGARKTNRGERDIEQLELRRGNHPDSELLSMADFLTRLDTHAPNPLIRSFNPLFMLGVLGGRPGHTILLVKLNSYENAFPGMLDWESRMTEDLLPLFIDDSELDQVPTATEFQDKTIQNHDTRVLKNVDGDTVLVYGFFDNSMLVIVDTEDTFRTIVNRLQSEKLSR